MAQISNILRTLFWILLFVQFTPFFLRNIKNSYTSFIEPKTKVGVISIKGALYDSTTLVNQLKTFFEDQNIKAILLKFDCPGGSPGAAQALFNEIKERKKQHLKPVISWIQSLCASGGYYVACATDHIIATPSAIVGSIGVYMPQPQLKEFIEQFKLKYTVIEAGRYKTSGSPFLTTTPEQEKHLKGIVNDTYRQFIADISAQRPKLTIPTSNVWADGKIFTGQQALALGIIDETGSQITTERFLKKKAQISGEIQWVRPACKSSLLHTLGLQECDDDSTEDSTYIEQAVTTACSYIDTRLQGTPQ